MGGFENLIQGIIVFLLIALIVMLILRELWCWYFKLNKMVSLLTEIRDHLKTQKGQAAAFPAEQRGTRAINSPPAQNQVEYQPKDIKSGEWVCTCGTVNNVYIPPHSRCTKCGKGMSAALEEQKKGASLSRDDVLGNVKY